MSHNTLREVTTVAGGPYRPETVDRTVGAWGLADYGYEMDGEPEVTVVAYPAEVSMAAADRPLGFGVALAGAVQVVPTERGQ